MPSGPKQLGTKWWERVACPSMRGHEVYVVCWLYILLVPLVRNTRTAGAQQSICSIH